LSQSSHNFFLFSAINTRQQDKVKHAVLALDRASRKARDRRRNGL
jgi:transportin-3